MIKRGHEHNSSFSTLKVVESDLWIMHQRDLELTNTDAGKEIAKRRAQTYKKALKIKRCLRRLV